MSALSIVAILLLLVLLPLAAGTIFVFFEEGVRQRKDARWLHRHS